MSSAEQPNSLAVEEAVRDLEARWRKGEQPTVEDYLLQRPTLAEAPDAVLDLIYAEFLAREAAGLPLPDADYAARFPRLADRFETLIRLHHSLVTPELVPPVPPLISNGHVSLPPRYLSPEEVGRGGMGIVYRAVDEALNRPVAVKVLFPHSGDLDRATRLRHEASALARIDHPGIVRVFDVGEYEGTAYLVMEYVTGGTLKDRLKAGLIPTREAAELVRTLAGAVAAAHRERIIHRDLKPSNVLLSGPDSSAVKLSDFGLAKSLDEESVSQSGAMVGTVAYVAPEQASQRRTVGPATDVYSLGAILYECLAGRPPFLGDTLLNVLTQVTGSEPIPPSRLRPGVPPDLEAVCLKCLEKDPKRRYQTAAELADDLNRFLADQPTAARPPSLANRVVRRARRNPMLSAFSAVTLLAVLAGVSGIAWQWRRAEQANTDLQGALEAEQTQRRVSEQLLYNATISQAVVFWEAGEVRKAREELASVVPRPGHDDLRGWEWYYLARLFRSESAVVRCDNWVNGITPSGGSEFAVAIGLPRLNTYRKPAPEDGRAGYLSWPAGGLPAPELRPGPVLPAGATALAVDRPGKRVAWGTADGRVTLSEAGTDRVLNSWELDSDVTGLSFAAGETLIAGCIDGSVRIIELGEPGSTRHAVWEAQPCQVAVAPDGCRAVCFGGPPCVRLFSVPDWLLLGEWSVHEGRVTAAAFAPDGTLVTGGVDGRLVTWNMMSGKPSRIRNAHTGPVYALAFHPDGRLLASGGSDKVVRLWGTADGEPCGQFRGHTFTVRSLCFGADPRWLASGGQDSTLRVWDTGENPLGRLLPFNARLNAAAVDVSADRILVRAASLDGLVGNWTATASGQTRDDTAVKFGSRKSYPVAYTAFLGAGKWVVGTPVDHPNTVAVWDSVTGRELFRTAPARGHVLALATDGGGKRVVWAVASGEGAEVHTWVPDEEDPSPPVFIPAASVRAVATTADGERIAVAAYTQSRDRGDVWLTTALGRRPISVTHGELLAGGLAFSPDGERLAASVNDDVRLFRAGTGEAISTAAAIGMATSVSFSPDGRRLAAVGYEGVASLIMPASGKVVFHLRGLASRRPDDMACDARVAFSPDGRAFISTNWDGSINVWDASLLYTRR